MSKVRVVVKPLSGRRVRSRPLDEDAESVAITVRRALEGGEGGFLRLPVRGGVVYIPSSSIACARVRS